VGDLMLQVSEEQKRRANAEAYDWWNTFINLRMNMAEDDKRQWAIEQAIKLHADSGLTTKNILAEADLLLGYVSDEDQRKKMQERQTKAQAAIQAAPVYKP
jgi:hypothetical protein